MKVSVIMDSYKDIQDVKKVITEKCNETLKVVFEDFSEQRVGILEQIDEYVLGIQQQLKGTKPLKNSLWSFSNREYGSVNGSYPTYLKLTFGKDASCYNYQIQLASPHNSASSYTGKIRNGHLVLDTQYDMTKEISQYEYELIKAWKDLKKDINNRIMSDFVETQNSINNRLNNAQEIQDLYDNFEV